MRASAGWQYAAQQRESCAIRAGSQDTQLLERQNARSPITNRECVPSKRERCLAEVKEESSIARSDLAHSRLEQ